MTALRNILGLSGGGVVSIVGAGGKTTLMFSLAREIAAAGQAVLTTTTTKILRPLEKQSRQVILSPDPETILEKARSLPGRLRHVTAGSGLIHPENKLTGFTAADIATFDDAGLFQWILVEADGAKQRPLKAPAGHEPVIPACSRWVIAVIGLDALNQPLTEEWVFRSTLYAALTGLKAGDRITERSVVTALISEEGIMKGCPPGASRIVFLNKADTDERREAGRRIAGLLQKANGPERVVVASLAGTASVGGRHKARRLTHHVVEAAKEKTPTAGIVLAAGMSSRMASEEPKQLLHVGGRPLLAWTLEAALQSELEQVVLVLGHEAEKIAAALDPFRSHPRLRIIINKQYREGMASSLHAGLYEVKDEFPSVMFLLGDQPLLGAAVINTLLRRFRESDKDICVPLCDGRQGNPVIFSSRFYDLIFGIRGDKGAREIIRAHPESVLAVEIADARCFRDIDSVEDARRLRPLLPAGR